MRVDQAVSELAKAFEVAAIETAKLDARLLVQAALGYSDMDMVMKFDHILSDHEIDMIGRFKERRLDREPVAHILGKREFWGLEFAVGPDTLVPRPDSETLIEAVLARVSQIDHPLRIVDIGTGSGCLLLALLSEFPNATGVGVDISWDALMMARQNAKALGFDQRVQFVQADYASALNGEFDILISNPPYLAAHEFDDLERDVAKYDPYSALVSGENGLEAYVAILEQMSVWQNKPHHCFFEMGYLQGQALLDLVAAHSFGPAQLLQDLAGRDRVVAFCVAEDGVQE